MFSLLQMFAGNYPNIANSCVISPNLCKMFGALVADYRPTVLGILRARLGPSQARKLWRFRHGQPHFASPGLADKP